MNCLQKQFQVVSLVENLFSKSVGYTTGIGGVGLLVSRGERVRVMKDGGVRVKVSWGWVVG